MLDLDVQDALLMCVSVCVDQLLIGVLIGFYPNEGRVQSEPGETYLCRPNITVTNHQQLIMSVIGITRL